MELIRSPAAPMLSIEVTPEGRGPVVATVNVLDHMSENDFAADIEKELTVALGEDCRVDRGGGENVTIRKANRNTTPDFTLAVTFNAIGLAITIQD